MAGEGVSSNILEHGIQEACRIRLELVRLIHITWLVTKRKSIMLAHTFQ